MNTRYTFKEVDEKHVAPIKDMVLDIVYPEKRYLGYRNSAIIRLKDGRNIPLLHYLAKLTFGDKYNMNTQEAIWSDTNWYNATPENITIIDRGSHTTKRAGRPSKLNLGVPYGHPDYQRRYVEATMEKQKEYRRKRYVQKRYEAIQAADMATPNAMPAPDDVIAPQVFETSNEQTASMSSRLEDILSETKILTLPSADLPTPKLSPRGLRWSSVASSPIPSSFTKEFIDGLAAAPVPGRENK